MRLSLGHLFGALCMFGLGLLAATAPDRCEVCGGLFVRNVVYTHTDAWTGEPREFCDDCRRIREECAVCRMPVKHKVTVVGDGRYLCERDVRLVILDDQAATLVLTEVRKDLDRLIARFITLPSTNIDFAFVSQVRMHQLIQSPGFERQCPLLLGTTRSLLMRDQGWQHEVRVLRALPRSEMIAVYVHELGHAWLREHVPPTRRITQQAEEGFCELLAYRYLEHIGETNQIARLLSNNYTEGHIDLFVEVYQTYDLNPVLNWMKYGVDPYLKEADLDRVRFVDIPAPRPPAAAEVIPVWSPPAPAPEQLTLTGLLGSGSRAVAMVNGGMVSAGETTTVRVGTNRVVLHCLSITTNQVTLDLPETGERVVLEWRPKP